MSMKSARFGVGIVAAAVAIGVVSTPMAANAEGKLGIAAQPPTGYPTSQIMATVTNPVYGDVPIRRGFYDADIDSGFGMDKAWHKHNLHSLNAQKVLMKSPNNTLQGNGNVDLLTYVGYYECTGGVGSTCTLKE